MQLSMPAATPVTAPPPGTNPPEEVGWWPEPRIVTSDSPLGIVLQIGGVEALPERRYVKAYGAGC